MRAGRETQKGPLPGIGTAHCERDPYLHLGGVYYSVLAGTHEMGCAGEKWIVVQCSRVGEIREETTLSESIEVGVTVLKLVSQYVDMKRTASVAVGLCPFRDDHHPSFGVNAEGNYRDCLARCDGGTVIDFWTKWQVCDFTMSIMELAEMVL